MNGRCLLCDEPRLVSANLGVCVECIRKRPHESEPFILEAHRKAREVVGLPVEPPHSKSGVHCNICSHECWIGHGGFQSG